MFQGPFLQIKQLNYTDGKTQKQTINTQHQTMKQSNEHWSEVINSNSTEAPQNNINNDLKDLKAMVNSTVYSNQRKTVFSTENQSEFGDETASQVYDIMPSKHFQMDVESNHPYQQVLNLRPKDVKSQQKILQSSFQSFDGMDGSILNKKKRVSLKGKKLMPEIHIQSRNKISNTFQNKPQTVFEQPYPHDEQLHSDSVNILLQNKDIFPTSKRDKQNKALKSQVKRTNSYKKGHQDAQPLINKDASDQIYISNEEELASKQSQSRSLHNFLPNSMTNLLRHNESSIFSPQVQQQQQKSYVDQLHYQSLQLVQKHKLFKVDSIRLHDKAIKMFKIENDRLSTHKNSNYKGTTEEKQKFYIDSFKQVLEFNRDALNTGSFQKLAPKFKDVLELTLTTLEKHFNQIETCFKQQLDDFKKQLWVQEEKTKAVQDKLDAEIKRQEVLMGKNQKITQKMAQRVEDNVAEFLNNPLKYTNSESADDERTFEEILSQVMDEMEKANYSGVKNNLTSIYDSEAFQFYSSQHPSFHQTSADIMIELAKANNKQQTESILDLYELNQFDTRIKQQVKHQGEATEQVMKKVFQFMIESKRQMSDQETQTKLQGVHTDDLIQVQPAVIQEVAQETTGMISELKAMEFKKRIIYLEKIIQNQEKEINTLEEKLDEFDGIDSKQIAELKKTIERQKVDIMNLNYRLKDLDGKELYYWGKLSIKDKQLKQLKMQMSQSQTFFFAQLQTVLKTYDLLKSDIKDVASQFVDNEYTQAQIDRLNTVIQDFEQLQGITIGTYTETHYEEVELTAQKIKQLNHISEDVRKEIRSVVKSLQNNCKALSEYITTRFQINNNFLLKVHNFVQMTKSENEISQRQIMKEMAKQLNAYNEGLEKHVVIYKEQMISITKNKDTESVNSLEKMKKINDFMDNQQTEQQSSQKMSLREGMSNFDSLHEKRTNQNEYQKINDFELVQRHTNRSKEDIPIYMSETKNVLVKNQSSESNQYAQFTTMQENNGTRQKSYSVENHTASEQLQRVPQIVLIKKASQAKANSNLTQVMHSPQQMRPTFSENKTGFLSPTKDDETQIKVAVNFKNDLAKVGVGEFNQSNITKNNQVMKIEKQRKRNKLENLISNQSQSVLTEYIASDMHQTPKIIIGPNDQTVQMSPYMVAQQSAQHNFNSMKKLVTSKETIENELNRFQDGMYFRMVVSPKAEKTRLNREVDEIKASRVKKAETVSVGVQSNIKTHTRKIESMNRLVQTDDIPLQEIANFIESFRMSKHFMNYSRHKTDISVEPLQLKYRFDQGQNTSQVLIEGDYKAGDYSVELQNTPLDRIVQTIFQKLQHHMVPEIVSTNTAGSESEFKINKAIFKGSSSNQDTLVFNTKNGTINKVQFQTFGPLNIDQQSKTFEQTKTNL